MDLVATIHVRGQRGRKDERNQDIRFSLKLIVLGALECWIPTINFILHSRIRIAKNTSQKSFLLMD